MWLPFGFLQFNFSFSFSFKYLFTHKHSPSFLLFASSLFVQNEIRCGSAHKAKLNKIKRKQIVLYMWKGRKHKGNATIAYSKRNKKTRILVFDLAFHLREHVLKWIRKCFSNVVCNSPFGFAFHIAFVPGT